MTRWSHEPARRHGRQLRLPRHPPPRGAGAARAPGHRARPTPDRPSRTSPAGTPTPARSTASWSPRPTSWSTSRARPPSATRTPRSGRRRSTTRRIRTTAALAQAIAAAPEPPYFVAGNAVAWYGDHGAAELTEAADTRGHTLMTSLCRDWQAAAQPGRRRGRPGRVPAHGADHGPRRAHRCTSSGCCSRPASAAGSATAGSTCR